ncbi:unnamed protein product [Coffea canephora]|uniref:Phosphoribosyltransferase domain-containing protein n=1 Tax=Coffea canephora TaxID=49390 RepID=A0A068VCW8_COFCA|nr:unnamed protein product [Coffea canephora]
MVDIFTCILIIILFHYLITYWMLVIIKWKVVCNKIYEGDKRIVRLKKGNSECCYIVIVDDLVQFGGTLIECQLIILLLSSQVLTTNGATKLSTYVMHGVFPNRSWEQFTAFAYFWITDSCPLTMKAIADKTLFKIFSLVGSIADALKI